MIFAANLKCNHTRASFKIYAEILNKTMGAKCDDIIVFPPSIAFLENELNFIQGAQNFYPCVNGAFTGELGKEHLDEFGIKCVLIGHSERRALGDENLIKAKFDFAKEHAYKIVFCIGEDLKLKNSNQTLDFLKKQLEVIDLDYKNLIIAYEPIYSIGSGVSAKKEDIAKVLEFLSSLTQAPLLYGGSVNEDNIKDILNIKHCSGVLIGSAALKAENFIKLIKG
ncbi:TPA: triose-phosphate isomerase [Campylobacter coli]|uniref:triose-phosphate isomerase n=1 Tax=Campylobacter coli TaxID=195 RepID=UPI0002581832|nr:triose-phosphate isomerase [Campylobacter coli]EKK1164452.1 triose-phosphate isomerase [Campylobacter jejuni]AHK72739.1 triosephosphate isomerase [Campylobacter coli RM1875]EAH6678843.1 triose-phosphate isomerase [Campylobacter coli]EAH6679859.1 triose-phosphate isomerase [Campylobacter coli]EAH6730922.1 triose-phosphate isomerase [Campylobacter coli]